MQLRYLFLVFFLPLVLAAPTKFHDAMHEPDDVWTIEENTYSVHFLEPYEQNWEEIILKVNNKGNFIEYEDCIRRDLNEYCFTNWSMSSKDSTISIRGQREPGVKLAFYKYPDDKTALKVTRTLSASTARIGEEVKVNVKVENTGDVPALGVYYHEYFPANVEVKQLFSIKRSPNNPNALLYEGFLPVDDDAAFSYVITPTTYDDHVFTGNLSFWLEGVETEGEVPVTTLKVPEPVKLTTSFSPSGVEPDEQATLKLTLKNNEPDAELFVKKLIVQVPRDVTFNRDTSLLPIGETGYIFSGFILPAKERSFTSRVKATNTGDYPIKVVFEGEINGEVFKEEKEFTHKVRTDKVTPIIELGVDSIRSGDEFLVSFKLENGDEEVYNNVAAHIESSLLDEWFNYDSILQDDVIPVKTNIRLKAPLVQESTKIPIKFNVSYATLAGEEFVSSTERSLTVTPVDQTFSIQESVGVASLLAGENTTRTVFIKNHLDDAVVVEVYDAFSDEIKKYIGNTYVEELLVPSKETVQAYVYQFAIPDDFPADALAITTTLHVPSHSYSEDVVRNITVTHSSGPINPPPEPEPEPEPVPEPEESVWQKVVNWFKNIFSKS